MKSIFYTFLISIITISSTFAGNETITPNEIGSKLPSISDKLMDVSGVELNVNDLINDNGLLILFSCNTCPYVLAWEDRYQGIANLCKGTGIGFVVLNPNEEKRADADSYEAMKAKAKESNYEFYYAVDKNHQWADALGATKTPDVFLFNGEGTLVYQGAIDDNMKNAESVEQAYLVNAIEKMLAGQEIDPSTTKAIGCSIKRLD